MDIWTRLTVAEPTGPIDTSSNKNLPATNVAPKKIATNTNTPKQIVRVLHSTVNNYCRLVLLKI